jgi:(2Fe-2S) ferredoxin
MTSSRKRRPCIHVCQYRSCVRSGAEAVFQAFEVEQQATQGFTLIPSECLGQCSAGPNVQVLTEERTWYCQVSVADVAEIVAQHIQLGQRVKRLLHPRIHQFDR